MHNNTTMEERKPFRAYNHFIGTLFDDDGNFYLVSHIPVVTTVKYSVMLGNKFAHFESVDADIKLSKEQKTALEYVFLNKTPLTFYKLVDVNDTPPQEGENYIYPPQVYFTLTAFLFGGRAVQLADMPKELL